MRLKDLTLAVRAGQRRLSSFVKTPSQTTGAGIWFDLSMSPGNPAPQYYFAAPLEAMAMARSSDFGLDHGQPVGAGYTKFLHKLMFQVVTSTAAPLAVRLLDYLLYYPGVSMDVGPLDLVNEQTLPRHVTGAGVQIMAVEQSSYVGGATFQVTYTNQDGTPGRLTPVVKCNAQIAPGTIATSALATAGCAGPFLPLQSGDYGVRSIEAIEFFLGDVGLLALVLVKPVARALVFEITQASEIDFLQEFGYLPDIADDAYLNFVVKPPGTLASAPIAGDIQTLWVAA